MPGRPWYRHQVYAPSTGTGYEAATLPGVREAIERRDWAGAEREIGRIAASVNAYAKDVDEATTLLLKVAQRR